MFTALQAHGLHVYMLDGVHVNLSQGLQADIHTRVHARWGACYLISGFTG